MRGGTTLAVIVGVSWLGGVAAAGEVTLEGTGLTVDLPDGWTVERLAFSDGDQFLRPDGAVVGDVSLERYSCAELDGPGREARANLIVQQHVSFGAWTGYSYTFKSEVTSLCKDLATADGAAAAAIIEAQPGEAEAIIAIVDAALERAYTKNTGPTVAIQLRKLPLTLQVPEDWVTQANDLGDDMFFHAAGAEVGLLHVGDPGYTCAQMLPVELQLAGDTVIATDVVPRAGWLGFELHDYLKSSEPFGLYCRDITIGLTLRMVVIRGPKAEVPPLLAALDAAVEAEGLRYFSATPEVATTTRDIAFQVHEFDLWMDFTLHVPDAWGDQRLLEHVDTFTLDDGRFVGNVTVLPGGCEKVLSVTALTASSTPLGEVVSGWSGHVEQVTEGAIASYCRDFTRGGGEYAVVVSGPTAMAPSLVRVVSAALDDFLGPTTRSPPSAASKFLPTRFELGFSRLTNGNEGTLDVPEGWGATVAVEKTLYGGGGPAWGYRARVTPTGVGTAGYLEGGIGGGFKGVEVQAVAGFGAAGSRAPLSVHAGIHAGLTIRFLEIEGGYRWTGGGTDFQFEGRFGIPGATNTYTMGIGYERREASSVITIDIGLARFGDLGLD